LPGRLLVGFVENEYRRAFRSHVLRAAGGEDLRFAMKIAVGGQPLLVRTRVVARGDCLAWALHDESDLTHAHEAAAAAHGDPRLESVQLGLVLERVRDGIVVIDRDLRVVFANRTAQALLAPESPLLGEPIPDFWSTSIRDLVTDLLERDALNAEALIEPDEHTAYWIRAFQTGTGQGAVLVLSDVTAEERREKAERDFVANAAHELQSPLTGISNAVELLLAGAHEDEVARLRFLGHISQESERLARLVQSLLLLAQAQSGEGRVQPEPFVLRPLLDDVVRAGAGEADVGILCPAGVEVVAHRDLLEHALENLVSNALRHGGGDRVIVMARPSTNGSVIIDVTDSGPGLTPYEQARAFDRFYRGSSRADGGFGLGLAIVREAVRAAGGDVELLSPGRGATARLRLPGSS
jgi:signal transduction histidine kinase